MSDSFVIPWISSSLGSSLSMGFPRQEYWSGLPLPSPGDLSDPGIETRVSCIAGGLFTTEPPGKSIEYVSEALKSDGVRNITSWDLGAC